MDDPGCIAAEYLCPLGCSDCLGKTFLRRESMGLPREEQRVGRDQLGVSGERLASCGIFDRQMLVRLVDDHHSGRRDHSAILWSLLMFDGFLRKQAEPAHSADPERLRASS